MILVFGAMLCIPKCEYLSALCPEYFLRMLTREEVSTSGDALLYSAGALKFLSGSGAVVKLLLDNSCIAVIQRLIQRLCRAANGNSTTAGHTLVQVCSHGCYHFHWTWF